MVSNIDPTKPETGIDQPVQVIRENFARAKVEIEDLQNDKISRNGGVMLGILQLVNFTVGSLPDPTLTPGGIVYVSDAIGGPTIAFSDGTNWLSLIDKIIIS